MPVYRLPEAIAFPAVELTAESGLLAVGGDLSPERLLAAYREGIFPWYGDGEPILWWSPDPRFVLFPDELRVSRSMGQFLKKGSVRITFDQAFREVIAACRRPRPGQNGTWITTEMREAYAVLHNLGFAHSVEVWQQKELVGGLYGVSLGRAFFGESMFSAIPNASKAALITLIPHLKKWGFDLIDCQVETAHLAGLGARPIPRRAFCEILKQSLRHETLRGNWGERFAAPPVENGV
ncbi:MAG: leucyl/phenylalanyl-tRNA--protein transferase [Deltaproteobacteria bacterium]|nr:leucyl/phenylalanyl-tRNA--protein transferase [Deltaproteobacteria bacterium]